MPGIFQHVRASMRKYVEVCIKTNGERIEHMYAIKVIMSY